MINVHAKTQWVIDVQRVDTLQPDALGMIFKSTVSMSHVTVQKLKMHTFKVEKIYEKITIFYNLTAKTIKHLNGHNKYFHVIII